MYEEIKIKQMGHTELEPIDFKKLHDKYLIDVTKNLLQEPVALSIGEYEYKGEMFPIPFGTYGNFSCLVGASKSMKTFLKSALVAGYIGGQTNNYFPGLKGHDTKDKFILDFDTEQSLFHTQRVVKRVCEMVGTNPSFYKTFTLREEDPKMRFQIIEWCILESDYRNNIGLIAIDGAADILDTVNDLDVSNKIVQNLSKWTTISKAHLCTVLHRNHGSDKPTGHLGSAIMKKAETVAFVSRDNGEITVTPNYTRSIPFEPFRFRIDENHLPVLIENGF